MVTMADLAPCQGHHDIERNPMIFNLFRSADFVTNCPYSFTERFKGEDGFFTGGGKLSLLGGAHARIDLVELRTRLAANRHDFVHETPAHVLSLSNLTESGAAYRPSEIAERAALAREAGLAVHLDGARLANALVSTGATPADMTWRAGVDVLSFGATKNGGLGCEATSPDGESATVTLSAIWRPPIVTVLFPEGLRIDATATASGGNGGSGGIGASAGATVSGEAGGAGGAGGSTLA